MLPWHVFAYLSDASCVISIDVDLYTCTPNAWSSISKLISLLHEEPWASQLEECSGLLRGYVSDEDFRYVWFDHRQSAGSYQNDFNQFSEGRALAFNNVLHWFYMPKSYRQFILGFFEAKCLQFGRVPFVWRTIRNEVMTQSSTPIACTLQSNRELFLVTSDSTDLIFDCAQSLRISAGTLLRSSEGNGFENLTVQGFPHHPFSCINVLESCNVPANQVPIQSRSMMIKGLLGTNAVTGQDAPKSRISSAFTDDFEVDEGWLPISIKEELVSDCEAEAQHDTQEDSGPCHDSLPALKPGGRKGLSCEGSKALDFKNIMNVPRRYAKLALARDKRHSELWGGSRGRIGNNFIIECPGCGTLYPPSPDSLYNMLCHLRTKHKKHADELLSSISESVHAVITFMQNRIAVWSNNNRKQM